MATLRAIAERRARVINRLNRTAHALASKLEIEAPELPSRGRDPELLRAMQLEAVASLLEESAVALGAMTREEVMDQNIGTTAEGQGPAQPNEDGFDAQLPEGAKAASREAQAEAKASTKTAVSEDLSALTVAELKDRARDAEVSGFSTMTKDELVKAVKKAEK
jgi:hypothetical protein